MMALPDEIISTVGPIVESVGADMSRRYRRYGLGQEDAAQQGWLFVFQHPEAIERWFDTDNYSVEVACKILARSLRNEVQKYGEQVKAQVLGYHADDVAYYDRGMVKALLPAMFDPEAWLDRGLPPEGEGDEDAEAERQRRKTVLLSEGNTWVATLADISQAYARLEDEDKGILAGFHRDNWSNDMMAQAYGLPKQTMSDRHARAIKRLVNKLGGERPAWPHDHTCEHPFDGWVGRRSISNGAARAYQSSVYEDE